MKEIKEGGGKIKSIWGKIVEGGNGEIDKDSKEE
jgi:hypothetical protein